jgi:uncharacterized protein (TIGR02594 family)
VSHPAAPWLQLALAEVGTKEVPGAVHNPAVLAYYAEAGHPEVAADEVAWCAAFTGAMLARAGCPLPPRNVSLLARSYLTYGIACEPQPGAIGIWPRGAAWQGHVGIVVAVDLAGGTCDLLAGNQGNAVSVQRYQLEEALDFRWPVAPTVAALRKAGSTEVRAADKLEIAGVGGAAVAAGGAAAAELLREAPPAEPVINPTTLTWIDTVAAAVKAIGAVVAANPWLGGVLLGALILLVVARVIKRRRTARAAAGAPLSMEVLR